jgi:glyoxylase-like metal-dependent hydrolase (beta-lactamase superfamily II)
VPTPEPVEGVWPAAWIHGHRPGTPDTDPPIQVHQYDERTVILRQSMGVHYEAPFLYLLFGEDRALLLDTGATADPARFPLRGVVDGLVEGWLAVHPKPDYDLLVAHTHAHGDHVAADAQFAGRAATTIIGHAVDDVRSGLGITEWPEQVVPLDLGGRVLEVTGIPGHQVASIAIYDPWTGFLLTGDTVYPGRLYVEDMPAFVDSLDRLVALADERPVRHVLGTHIEMSTGPGHDYPLGFPYHPDEPPLQMTVAQLRAVRDHARAVQDRPGVSVFDDVIIWNGHPLRAVLRQLARGWAARLRYRFGG